MLLFNRNGGFLTTILTIPVAIEKTGSQYDAKQPLWGRGKGSYAIIGNLYMCLPPPTTVPNKNHCHTTRFPLTVNSISC